MTDQTNTTATNEERKVTLVDAGTMSAEKASELVDTIRTFPLEMSEQQIADRMIASMPQVDPKLAVESIKEAIAQAKDGSVPTLVIDSMPAGFPDQGVACEPCGTVNCQEHGVPRFSVDAETSAPLAKGATPGTHNHTHGPWCNHAHEGQDRKVEQFLYVSVKDVPPLDWLSTFNAHTEGPLWFKNGAKSMNYIRQKAGEVPEGAVSVLFLNVHIYQHLIANAEFRRYFQPSHISQIEKSGLMGIYARKMLVMCDVGQPEAEWKTQHLAVYFVPTPVHAGVEMSVEEAAHHELTEKSFFQKEAESQDSHAGDDANALKG